jgi:hypothetical protein
MFQSEENEKAKASEVAELKNFFAENTIAVKELVQNV